MSFLLKAVLFDLDGVIVDTAKYHYLAWKRLADEQGIHFDERINERLKGVSRMASLEIILERGCRPYMQEEKQKLTEIKNRYYLEMIECLRPDDLLPGVLNFLNSLKIRGIKSAICSASRSAGLIIGKLGVEEYFDTVVGGGDVSKSKPDPEVFLTAAGRLGIGPCECVVIEDAFAGLEGAKKAGMKALGLGNPEVLLNADAVYKDMTAFTPEDIIERFKEMDYET